VALAGAGGFAFFLCLNGHFLPHDVQALGFDAAQLARTASPRLVNFMFHDRAAFGGSLVAIGTLYFWLVEFPLRAGCRWAWWTLALSGALGFATFLYYLGYGYLDTWHGVATLLLLPVFVAGLARSWKVLPPATADKKQPRFTPLRSVSGTARAARWFLAAYGAGLVAAGATISVLGMTRVFVATDLAYIGMSVPEVCGVSEKLVPVISHDRAGFGGGLISTGLVVVSLVLHAPLSRGLVQALALSGAAGFGGAIGIHYFVGYTDPWHVAPAWVGAVLWAVGTLLAWRALAQAGAVMPETRTADAALRSPKRPA
jgi:hypothetical protein